MCNKSNKRRNNGLLAFIVAVAMIIAVMPFNAAIVFADDDTTTDANTLKQPEGAGTSENPYQITCVDELYWFAGLVNGTLTDGTEQNKAAYAELKNDITVNEAVLDADNGLNDSDSFISWTPIGNDKEQYTGTFDGNGHTISGLYYTGDTKYYVGLFGYIGGRITNVTVKDSYFYAKNFVGGICGENVSGTISNCNFYGAVYGNVIYGGICGENMSGAISNCYAYGTVTTFGSTSSTAYEGGICGYNYNSGKIIGCYFGGTVSGTSYKGSICGYNSYNSSVSNCYSDATVTGSNAKGGICGYNKLNSTISNCYFVGSVISSSGDAGTICGYNNSGCGITNCYYFSADTETIGGVGSQNGTATNVDAKTAEQFASGEVCFLLNDGKTGNDLVWYQIIGFDTYPVLDNTHSVVYGGYKSCGDAAPTCSNTDIEGYLITKPEHNYEYFDEENHKCSSCGGEVKHSYIDQGDETHKCSVCGNVEEHSYLGVTCACGLYEEPTLNDDNYYVIDTASKLYWFAIKVNFGSTSINGILTANITVNSDVLDKDYNLNDSTDFVEWIPIGNSTKKYSGTFKGNGYTISGLYFNNTKQSYIGLFGYNSGSVTNVAVKDSYFSGSSYVGGICGYNYTKELSGCSFEGSINNTGSYTGGISGRNKNIISNCYAVGNIVGKSYIGGICGGNDSSSTISNCYYNGTATRISSYGYVGAVCGYNYSTSSIINCYYLDTGVAGMGNDVGAAKEATAKTAEEFASGEVCYLLNGSKSDSDCVWHQKLGNDGDAYPIFKGLMVYYDSDNDSYYNEYIAGDVDFNGTVDKIDAAIVLKYIGDIGSLTDVQQKIADVSGDDEIDMRDVIGILNGVN